MRPDQCIFPTIRSEGGKDKLLEDLPYGTFIKCTLTRSSSKTEAAATPGRGAGGHLFLSPEREAPAFPKSQVIWVVSERVTLNYTWPQNLQGMSVTGKLWLLATRPVLGNDVADPSQ